METHGVLETIGAMPTEAVGFCLVIIACYLLPATIAFANNSKSKWEILFINVVLGWSVLFWFVALLFAFATPKLADQ